MHLYILVSTIWYTKKDGEMEATKFFFFFPSYFGNVITTNSFPHFFSLYFGNAIATNSFPQFFFPLFRQCHCHKPIAIIFFPSYFGDAIATNSFPQFFFPSISTMPLPQIHSHNFLPSISKMPLPQINCRFFFFFFKKWYVHTIFTTNPKW